MHEGMHQERYVYIIVPISFDFLISLYHLCMPGAGIAVTGSRIIYNFELLEAAGRTPDERTNDMQRF